MKKLTGFFAAFGVFSGFLFFAARILYSHPHSPTPSQLLAHIVTSAPLILTHSLNVIKLRNPTSKIPRAALIVLNVFMAFFFFAGILYLRSTGCGVLKLGTFTILWLVPFVVNSIYFIGFASKPRAAH
jgi:hypothetical protein